MSNNQKKIQLFTIGVYGSNEDSFFDSLLEYRIDTFCDIRLRRGMRGSKYIFVNSNYLQTKLASLGIQYVHYKQLAPSKTTREKQKLSDEKLQIRKRDRYQLSPVFVMAYEKENLSYFDSVDFVRQLGENTERIVLFCVERDPAACHRSLLAERLAKDMNLEVRHVIP